MCEHQFAYAGVRYRHGTTPLPGTGATRRYYAHVYFCAKCVETRGTPIVDGERNSYMMLEFGATPGTAKECGVPPEDDR